MVGMLPTVQVGFRLSAAYQNDASMSPFLALRLISAAAFFFYGVHCLVSPSMGVEFERYGVPKLRVLTAVLEIVGALGLLLGPTPQWVGAAATGLCALMIAALIVRVRIEDPWHLMLPAFILLLGNGWLAARGWRG
jgi:uncharacterized membrane protein YphA (DoxX/SURF4 family)